MRRVTSRVSALAGLAILILSSAATAQTFRVLHFGDSITYAIPFDLGGGSPCQSGNPDTCGIPGRLAGSAYYNCGAADCAFYNRGRSGELTAQGVSRIDSALRERSYDLVVVMQGTNDISAGISPATVAFNLDRMADKAESQGAGVARSSIIRLNPSIAKDQTASQNNAAQTLRDRVSRDASGDRDCFVDAWSALCPSGGSCLSSHYWTPAAGTIDHVGHPNSRGYDQLAREFFRVLGGPGAPGAVTMDGPTGEACGERLLVEWQRETQARASCGNSYRIQISGPGGTKLDRWIPEEGICGSQTCNAIAPVKLRKGMHAVRIQTRNSAGYGPWSEEIDFDVVPSAPDGIRKLREPEGEIFGQGGAMPDFKWKPQGPADAFRIEINSNSGVVVDEVITDAVQCDENECVYSLEERLAAGRYTWRVRAENICGGTWSDPSLFQVFEGPPAAAPATDEQPRRVFANTPGLHWKAVDGATDYEIEDPLGNVVRIAAADACSGDVCRYLSPLLPPGPRSWRVRAVNPLGEGAWSAPQPLEVVDCDCIEGKAAGGAPYLLAVPPEWNGELVIWSYEPDLFGVREATDFGPLAQRQFDEGYALATSGFGVSGWPLFRSSRDLQKLYSIFLSRVGTPDRVYLAGKSTGALVTAAALEGAKLGNVVGALAMCGPMAGSRNWEGALDLRLAYDAICSGVAGAAIPGGAQGLPEEHSLTPFDVAAAVNFCTGVDKPKSDRTQEEKQLLKALLEVTHLPEEGLQRAMRLATFGLADLVHDKKKRLRGRLPVGNEGVVYDVNDLDLVIERVKAHGQAENKLERFSQLTGKIDEEVKVVSLHTTLDPFFFVENQTEYAELVPEENLLLGIADESEPSHCGFDEVEELAAWKTLTVWVENGRHPQPRHLDRRCRQLRSVAEGSCRFEKRPRLDSLDSRIRPRPE